MKMSRKMRTAPPPSGCSDTSPDGSGTRGGRRRGRGPPGILTNLMKVPLKSASRQLNPQLAADVNTDAIREERERWGPRGPFQELQTKVFCSSGGANGDK